MPSRKLVAFVVAVLAVSAISVSALASGGDDGSFRARLRGYQETPSVNSAGTGQFSADVNSNETSITYTLTYSGLGSAVGAAHIHFAQRGVAGGVVAFLCGGGSAPACPPSGTVTGTIGSADILALPDQGIAAGDLASVLKAMRAGFTYVNVHTANFPNGEIRGQIKENDDD